MKTKKLPLFYIIYFSLLAVFFIALICFSIYLSNFIKQYNQGIPETVSQRFFESTFLNLDPDKIIEMSGEKPCEFETTDDLKAFITENFSNDLTYTSISSDIENTKTYIVKSGEYKIATFTLICDKNNDYSPSTLSLHLPKHTNKTVRILSSSSLTINGVPVTDEYIVNREPHKNAMFLPEEVSCPEWLTYEISGLTKEPQLVISDRNGNKPQLLEEDGILCEQVIYDEPEKEIVDRLLTAAKKYAACMQNDESKYSVLPYFEKGTDIYESIRTVENTFVWDHAGYSIEDENISEFMRYDENTVSVRISFTHTLKMHGREDYHDITDITYFARCIDGKYYIFNRYNNI
ncbi:MAG: hypothetical protein J6K12_05730 [Clostridia bacterium]|nr:hypothetical protein [Clostridia bacterium]